MQIASIEVSRARCPKLLGPAKVTAMIRPSLGIALTLFHPLPAQDDRPRPPDRVGIVVFEEAARSLAPKELAARLTREFGVPSSC